MESIPHSESRVFLENQILEELVPDLVSLDLKEDLILTSPPSSPPKAQSTPPTLKSTTKFTPPPATQDLTPFTTPETCSSTSPMLMISPASPEQIKSSFLTNSNSPESPGTLALRRVANGQLPSSALAKLNRMRFDNLKGLGVGGNNSGNSPSLESPSLGFGSIGEGAGLAFQLAMGSSSSSTSIDSTMKSLEISDSENLPINLRNVSRRRLMSLGSAPPLEVKIPPSLIGSPLLNRSPKQFQFSPTQQQQQQQPPLSPLFRTSAGSSTSSYSMNGPLTPLTPSNMPSAPKLDQCSQFSWGGYSPCSSPADTPSSPSYYELPSNTTTTNNAKPLSNFEFFLPSPPAETPLMSKRGRMNSSPLSGKFSER